MSTPPVDALNVHSRFGDRCLECARGTGRGFMGLICGPMFSGKTTTLIKMHEYLLAANDSPHVRVRCFNYEADDRYGSATTIASHDANGVTAEAVAVGRAADFEPFVEDTDVFLVNEGQFIAGMFDLAERLCGMGKSVVVAGLDLDYTRSPFPETGAMMRRLEGSDAIMRCVEGDVPSPLPPGQVQECDAIMRCVAFCDYCRNAAAPYTHRTSSEEAVVVIGGKEKYIPVCGSCWDALNPGAGGPKSDP